MKANNNWLNLVWAAAAIVWLLIVAMCVGGEVEGPDLSWAGWRASVERYERSRAPDEPYSTQSLQGASEGFRRAIEKREHSRSVHWAGVRLVCETLKLTWLYRQSEEHGGLEAAPLPSSP